MGQKLVEHPVKTVLARRSRGARATWRASLVAGWAGMRLLTFLILDLIGTLMWAGTLAGLGYELGHHAVAVAKTISHYGLWISLGLVAVIIFFQVRSQRHMMRAAAEV